MKNLIFSLLLCVAANVMAAPEIPMVYDIENTSSGYPAIDMPDIGDLPEVPVLPDPFAWADGSGRSERFEDWPRHRSEIMQRLQHYETGEKPEVARDSVEAWMDCDTLRVRVHEKGEILDLSAVIEYPEGEGPFPAMIGIMFPYGSLPPELLKDRGVAGISFNFMQVMSHTQKRGEEPINRLYPEHEAGGAYSAWPWGISRIIDGLEIVGEKSRIDLRHIGVTGCSFAGKMALFAGALDERIALTIAQEPGGGGVDAWRVSETLGNVETLGRTNFAWFKESMRMFAEDNVSRLPIDHHEVAALIAPRALLVLGNPDYEWLAEESNYVACRAARRVWESFGIAGRMGFSIVGGHPHCQLPVSQYADVAAFVGRFLLGEDDADTEIVRADMFADVDWKKWLW